MRDYRYIAMSVAGIVQQLVVAYRLLLLRAGRIDDNKNSQAIDTKLIANCDCDELSGTSGFRVNLMVYCRHAAVP